jgi:hypothetical protein
VNACGGISPAAGVIARLYAGDGNKYARVHASQAPQAVAKKVQCKALRLSTNYMHIISPLVCSARSRLRPRQMR